MNASRVIHFAQVDFRNDNRLFGIKHEDRFSHLYIIGKTGTGKSTLLETMALQDLEAQPSVMQIAGHKLSVVDALRRSRRRL
jgi:ABC-type lipoprotein export system ATPase subunit